MPTSDLIFTDTAGTSPDLVFGGVTRDTDLVFSQPQASHPTDLVFGGGGDDVHPDRTATIAAILPGLYGPLAVALGLRLSIAGALPGLQGGVSVTHSNYTQRPEVAHVHGVAQIAAALEAGTTQPEQHALSTDTGVQHLASHAVYAHAGNTPAFKTAIPVAPGTVGCVQEGVSANAHLLGRLQDGDPAMRLIVGGYFQDGTPLRADRHCRLQDGLRDRRTSRTTRWQDASARRKPYTGKAGPAAPNPLSRRGRYQDAWPPRAGTSPRPVVPVVPPPYWGTALVFACPPLAASNLVFGTTQCTVGPTGGATLYILPARFYMTAHTILAHRLPDLAEVPIFDATVSADAGSYCWTLSASGPSSLFEQLAPQSGLPAQLRITLDGIPFVFAVDALSRSGSFGKTGVSVSGRSVTALIGAPYLRATSRDNTAGDRLAQQLANDALEYSGVTLDWGITDWLVPAGAWSHNGTPLDAVQAIAQAAGGYLQSHRSAATLLTRHPYSQRVGDNPGAPWGWMTGPADVELAQDAIITDGTERNDGADINAVYVSGTGQGVLALVKRAATAGDKLAAMVTDPLITHVDAARQRGLSILGAAGGKYHVRLELPVLTGMGQPGVLDVGQLVQVNAAQPWRGRVRAVSVSAKRPSLRQTITLERHLEVV